ncbi:alanine racemase [Cohnella cholangitidis]|uniref:Alanine racemase n=1 Tax=Cohnella cholangitidis TaxID=2598458 RepID=A0A7G5C252_9BACL|nr:alanine racemase [Cohnella cholangitidis]QMV43286.1 alanine racemase [Cohnella cholangitidis]
MDCYYRPTVAEISLDALDRNIGAFRERLAVGTKLLASVKANAYGHGAVEIARRAVASGADYLGVAFLDEALQLRASGIDAPILVLGYTPPEGYLLAREQGITVTLYRDRMLDEVESLPLSTDGKKLKAHIKIDSGMGRLGLLPGPQAERFMERAFSLPQLEVEGLFTHYARADEEDKAYTHLQVERFAGVVDYVRRSGLPISIIHSGNSAAGIDLPENVGHMLRLGISMYGLYPSDEVNFGAVRLEPVLSLKTSIVHTKRLPAGEGISYGTRYFTQGEEVIGTLPIGYADGFSRMLSGKAEVLVRGQRVPVLGTICMDQCMIRLNDAASGGTAIEPGEEVVIIGRQGDAILSAEEVAAKLGTINYELICMLAARVPRVYRSGNEILSVVNPLLG